MKPEELKQIRAKLELSGLQFGRALGMGGTDNTVNVQIYDMESGKRPIPERTARLVRMFQRFGVPEDF